MNCEIYVEPDEWCGDPVLDVTCIPHGVLCTFYGQTAFSEVNAEVVLHLSENQR